MHNEKKLFAEAVSKLGYKSLPEGIFPLDGFGGILKDAKDREMRRVNRFVNGDGCLRRMKPVILDYIDYPKLNAFAFQYGERNFIAISAPGIALIYYAMYKLLSHPSILEEIGNPELEVDCLPASPLTTDIEVLIQSFYQYGGRFDSYFPKCEQRRRTAYLMATFAVNFIKTHEFRHLQAGHVEFLQDNFGYSGIDELRIFSDRREQAMIQQAFEMDADSFGMRILLSDALRYVQAEDAIDSDMRLVLTDSYRATQLTILSVYIVFKLFHLSMTPSNDWELATHPPPYVRNLMQMANVKTLLEDWNQSDLSDQLQGIIARVITIVEQQLEEAFGVAMDRLSLKVLIDEGPRHGRKIVKTWRNIRDDLSRYSHVSIEHL